MQKTQTRSIAHRGSPGRMAPWLCAVLLAAAPGAALAQSLNTNAVRLANPTVSAQPSLRLARPSLTVRPITIQPSLPSAVRATPNLPVPPVPTLEAGRIGPSLTAPEASIDARPQIGLATAATIGLGRLVAPGTENSNVVVARIGSSAARADVPTLTVDFDGDGLINFEIAPGIVEVAPEAADQDAGDASGLVGRHVTMATGTADLVLDGVINTDGIVAATTFEIQDGAVVLGGGTTAPAIEVDIARIPEGTTTPGSDGGTGHRPGETRGDDQAGKDTNGEGRDPTRAGCVTHVCDREDLLPGPDEGPDANGPFQFSGHVRPMPANSDFDSEPGDLIDVSILLPLRRREPETDQFSNHGNEEIW